MPNKLMGLLRTRNISHIITERITESILNGELVPGQRLPTEEEFAKRIGAGKSSVREAIKILEAQGVLEIRRGDGTYVVDEFKGSMLDPILYGVLLAKKIESDVIDFKVRVQQLAFDELLEHSTADCLARANSTLEAGQRESDDDRTETLVATEQALADEVENPLVGELYRQAARIATHCTQSHTEALLPWMRQLLQALEQGDAETVHGLLAMEREILLGNDSQQ